MSRIFNFCAGPALLPEDVLKRAQADMLDWHGTGMSPMEVGHRSHAFMEMAEKAEKDLRDLVNVPDNYHVLFLSGGATTQFGMVPLNLLGNKTKANYLATGQWSKKAEKEAARYCDVNVVGSLIDEDGLKRLPRQDEIQLDSDAAYCYYCDNETIDGAEFSSLPVKSDIPLVVDVTSNFLSRPIDVSAHGIIFGSSQKNFGHAGITAVIIRDDLVGHALDFTPTMCNYKTHVDSESLYNTPPTYAWYFAGLMFDWIKEQGGVEEMDRRAKKKIAKLYSAIDGSDFYKNNVATESRSRLNVPFTLHDPSLDGAFIEGAKEYNLYNLKGHRSVGGMRASVYLAMSDEGVEQLVDYMREFERKHG